MERAAQPHERLKSFDPLASVDMMRFDQERFGHVLPETRQRVYDEELSYIVEGINRASRTEFTLQRNEEGQLVYFDEGRWVRYGGMLYTGLEVAKAEARTDYRKEFLVSWAERDQEIGFAMQRLQPGQTLSWHNSYPHEVEARLGQDFLKTLGLQPNRKLGFLYQAKANEDGSITLRSQTIDRSDPEALAAVDAMLQYDTSADLTTMLKTYDGTLHKKYGESFYAGRKHAEVDENAWDELLKHRDLIDYLMSELEVLSRKELARPMLESLAVNLKIGVWKAFKMRLGNKPHNGHPSHNYGPDMMPPSVAHEVQRALQTAIVQQDIMPGCGGAIRASMENASQILKDGFDKIFGDEQNSRPESSYKFDKLMFCVVCQAPPNETEKKAQAKKMCGPCGICKGCDSKLRAKKRGSFALAS